MQPEEGEHQDRDGADAEGKNTQKEEQTHEETGASQAKSNRFLHRRYPFRLQGGATR